MEDIVSEIFDNMSEDVPRTPIICYYHYKPIDPEKISYYKDVTVNFKYYKGGYYGYSSELITESRFVELIKEIDPEYEDDLTPHTKCIHLNTGDRCNFWDERFMIMLPNEDCITMMDLFLNNTQTIQQEMAPYIDLERLLEIYSPIKKEKDEEDEE